jgi:hypothetical protein
MILIAGIKYPIHVPSHAKELKYAPWLIWQGSPAPGLFQSGQAVSGNEHRAGPLK